MGGIFGGLLSVIEGLGGLFLFILVGGKAWKRTKSGKQLRTFFGGAVLGLLVGIGLYRFVLPEDAIIPLWLVLVVGMAGGVFLGLILYTIYVEPTGESTKKIRVYYRTTVEQIEREEEPTQE